jgi:hypothetical protein
VPRARSKRDGCRKALGIKTSAVRQFCERGCTAAHAIEVKASQPLTPRGALAARVAHNHEVGRSIRSAATNRVSPSLVTERVCKTFAYVHAEFDSRDTHHMRPWSIGRASECHSDDASSILAGRTLGKLIW